MEEQKKQMDFFDLKQWLKAHNLTFKLEGWSGCIPDTILIKQGDHLIYEGDYYPEVDYIHAVNEIRELLHLED